MSTGNMSRDSLAFAFVAPTCLARHMARPKCGTRPSEEPGRVTRRKPRKPEAWPARRRGLGRRSGRFAEPLAAPPAARTPNRAAH